MLTKCKECGKEYELESEKDISDFQCECGGELKEIKPTHNNNQFKQSYEYLKGQNSLIKLGLFCLILIIGVGLVLGSGYFSNDTINSSTITLSNEEFTYKTNSSKPDLIMTTDLVSNKNYDYLQMVTVWYDQSGNIIKKNTVWSINSVQAEQVYKINSNVYLDSDASKVDILVFDSRNKVADDLNAIYSKRIKLT